MAAQIAPTNIAVLLCGESGTGKEVLGRRIHSLSRYSDEPLHTIACGWMSADRVADHFVQYSRPVEDELPPKTGTLFLDEPSDLDAASQSALLRAIPDGETLQASGAIAPRLISSTTRDLVNETRQGRFPSELYRRLSGICFHLLPLRERREDLPGLVQFLLAKHAARFQRPRPSLRTESLDALFQYAWPGNIRELENVILRILLLEDEELVISELRFAPAWAETAAPPPDASCTAAPAEVERQLTLEALTRTARSANDRTGSPS